MLRENTEFDHACRAKEMPPTSEEVGFLDNPKFLGNSLPNRLPDHRSAKLKGTTGRGGKEVCQAESKALRHTTPGCRFTFRSLVWGSP